MTLTYVDDPVRSRVHPGGAVETENLTAVVTRHPTPQERELAAAYWSGELDGWDAAFDAILETAERIFRMDDTALRRVRWVLDEAKTGRTYAER